MTDLATPLQPSGQDPTAARRGGRQLLAAALTDARSTLLALWQAYERGLPPDLRVPQRPSLNLPLWELGHVAWFEEWWLARNPLRQQGAAAEPEAARAPSLLTGADALYNSSAVAHAQRWELILPDARRSLAYAARVRERTLRLLQQAPATDEGLYFFRLALHHEDMHREAWIYMAQALDLRLDDSALAGRIALQPAAVQGDALLSADGQTRTWSLPAQVHRLGHGGPGFAFDNELGAHEVELAAFTIDRAPVTWQRYLPFIEAGGYSDAQWWTAEGAAWRQRHGQTHPLNLRPGALGGWEVARFGQWQRLNEAEPAMHLSQHEALAWCRWAGRRLPTEAEWSLAAQRAAAEGQAFATGQVWEWTASPFGPFPGFVAHPYRDYSQPWFDGRPVLKGGSFATAARIQHPNYRNFFPPGRNDLFTGFRSCTV